MTFWAGDRKRRIKAMERLDMLPNANKPLLLFLGVTSDGGDAVFLVDSTLDATETMRAFYRRFLVVTQVPVPVIAAVNGHAIGAGLCVALACDLLLVAEDARVGLNFARLGLHPGMAGSWLLPRRRGFQRAARWLYTGELVSGAEAAAQGLALEALPADAVLPRALELAAEIAQSAPRVVRQLKQTLAAAAENDLRQQLDLEAANQALNYRSSDITEGLAAVRDRRAPSF